MKNQKFNKFFLVLPFLILVLTACGQSTSEIAGEKIAEKIIESQTGSKVDIDTSEGSVKMESEDGKFETGDDIKLPTDFPSDVYVVEGKIKAAINVNGSYSITIETERDIKELSSLYQEKLIASDWKITGTMDFGESANIVAEKDTRNVSIMFAKSDSKTSVIISLGKK